jgi:sodium/hydrogen exchanger 10/11
MRAMFESERVSFPRPSNSSNVGEKCFWADKKADGAAPQGDKGPVPAGWCSLGVGWKGLSIAFAIYFMFDVFGGKAGGDAVALSPHVPYTPPDLERRLSSSTTSGSTSGSSSAGSAAHADHPYQTIGLVFYMLLVGQAISHLQTFKTFAFLQPTVAMFMAGIVLSFFLEDGRADQLDELLPPENALWGGSYVRWVNIDHHLLLFALLPPLLAGDAMSIDVPALHAVFCQCLYLAGPGVLFNSFCVAGVLKGYTGWVYIEEEQWDFIYCLVVSSILCATDPVAVVSLLKELGASPTLTVQIQGESLLNDGTAIVMFGLAYRMVMGEQPTVNDVMSTLIKMALYAWVVGLLVGGGFLLWMMNGVAHAHNHSAPMLQLTLTIVCCYTSFILSEMFLGFSGVLATVSSSFVLAGYMWPYVLDKHTMHVFWHMLEYLGNTIIFQLAGMITGKALLHIDAIDYVHLIVIYIVLVLIRGGFIVCSRPILRLLHSRKQEVSLENALVMSWGGLRGAVGLALAIQVVNDRAGGVIPMKDAQRCIFFVGGIALMTLLINAMTCPMLVRHLGVTATPNAKKTLTKALFKQLEKNRNSNLSPLATRKADDIFEHMRHLLECDGDEEDAINKGIRHITEQVLGKRGAATVNAIEMKDLLNSKKLEEEYETTQLKFDCMGEDIKSRVLGLFGESPILEEDTRTELYRNLEKQGLDVQTIRALNEVFLALVQSNYGDLMSNRQIPRSIGSLLLKSIAEARYSPPFNISDFKTIIRSLCKSGDERLQRTLDDHSKDCPKSTTKYQQRDDKMEGGYTDKQGDLDHVQKLCANITAAPWFIIMMVVSIVINSFMVYLDDSHGLSRQVDFWILWIFDLLFVIIFSVEVVIRCGEEKMKYFISMWNWLDVCLALLGTVTCYMDLQEKLEGESGSASDAKQATNPARALKGLKILRALRVVRLVKAFKRLLSVWSASQADEHIADLVGRMEVLLSFIKAHRASQHDLFVFLGGPVGCLPEAARCVLQSQREVLSALHLLGNELEFLNQSAPVERLLEERRTCIDSIELIKEYKSHLEGAQDRFILNGSEASMLLHNLDHSGETFEKRVVQIRKGMQLRERIHGFSLDDYRARVDAADTGVASEQLRNGKNPVLTKDPTTSVTFDLAGERGNTKDLKGVASMKEKNTAKHEENDPVTLIKLKALPAKKGKIKLATARRTGAKNAANAGHKRRGSCEEKRPLTEDSD